MKSHLAILVLIAVASANAATCVVEPPNSFASAIDVMFDAIKITEPVVVDGTKDGIPTSQLSVPQGTEDLTFEFTFCTASETTFFTSGDHVRFGTIDPIYIIEPGRGVTGNVLAIGLQPGDLGNADATIIRRRNESFSVTDTVTFDISDLAPGDYTVEAFQGLPWIYVDTSEIHQDGDLTSAWHTSAIMTVTVPETTMPVSVFAVVLVLVSRRFLYLRANRKSLLKRHEFA